jgi:DUF4097 and DUF4098 domain-containing protein YvlB
VQISKRTKSSFGVFAAFLAAGTLLTGCNISGMVAKESRSKTISSENLSNHIEIDSKNGSIAVLCQPGISEAQIEVDIVCRGDTQEEANSRLAATELVIQNDDGKLKIYPKFPEPLKNGDGASIRLAIPSAENLVLKTSNGAVDVDGSLSQVTGKVEVQTSNGSIKVRSAQSVNLESSNGAVTLEKISGDVNSTTSNASTVLTGIGGKIDVLTSNGSITAKLGNGQFGPIQARTSNSSIKLEVGSDFFGKVEVETSNARVGLKDPAGRVTENGLKKSSGTVTIGSGGGDSALTTSNGAVDISVAGN